MGILQKLDADIITAMKAREAQKLEALRMVKSALKSKEIDKREPLTEAGVTHTIETYPAHHGFAVADNPSYDEAAAERHWQAMEKLFGAALG